MKLADYNKLVRQRMTAVNPLFKAALAEAQKNPYALEQLARLGRYEIKVGGRSESLVLTLQLISAADEQEQESP